MSERKPKGLIDRVIKSFHCPDGKIENLLPDAFLWRKGEPSLSFRDRDQSTPAETLVLYNKSPDMPPPNLGVWTVAIRASQAEQLDGITKVWLDSDEDASHVAVELKLGMNRRQKAELREELVELAKPNGLNS